MAEVTGRAYIDVEGTEAGKKLEKLEKQASDLRKEINAVNKAEVIDKKKLTSLNSSLKKVQKEQEAVKRSAFSYKKVLEDINGASLANLTKAHKQLSREVRTATRGTEEFAAKQKQLGVLSQEMGKVRKEMRGINVTSAKTPSFIGKATNAFNNFAGIAMGAIAAITGIILAFRKIGDVITEFEKSLTNVYTLLSQDDLERFGSKLEQGSIDIMKQYGSSIEDTNKALFDTISAGINAGDSIAFMDEASRLAVGGVTDLSTSVDGMTTVYNAWGLSMSEVDNISASFFSAQKAGKTTVEELAQNIGKVAPIAANLGVTYQELMSAQAELTKQGIATAESTTMLKAVFSNLQKPGAEAEAVLRKFGVPVGATEIKAAGFTQTLEKLNQVVQENPDAIAKAIPSVEGLTAILALSGEGLDDYKNIMNDVNNDVGENSSLMSAFAMQNETAEQAMKRAKGQLTAMALSLREELTPIIKAVISKVSIFSNVILKSSANNQKFIEFIKQIVIQGDGLISFVMDFYKSFAVLGKEFGMILKNLGFFSDITGTASLVIKGLTASFMLATYPMRTLIKRLMDIFKAMNYVLSNSKLLKMIIKEVSFFFNKLWENIKSVTDGSTVFGKVIKDITDDFKALINVGKQVIDFILMIDDENKKAIINNTNYISDLINLGDLVKKSDEVILQAKIDADKKIKQLRDKAKAEEILAAAEKADANRKKYEEIAKANKDLQDYIQNINKELLVDAEQKAIEELRIWKIKETKKINSSKASAKIKKEALEKLDLQYNQKLNNTTEQFANERVSKLESINKFLADNETNLLKTREEILAKETTAIEEKYNKQIELALSEAAKENELSKQFAQIAIDLEKQKQDEIAKHQIDSEKALAEEIKNIRKEYDLLSSEEKMQEELDKLDSYLEQKFISEVDYEIARANIIKTYKDAEHDAELKRQSDELSAFSDNIQEKKAMLTALSNLVSQHKTFELTELEASYNREMAMFGNSEESKKNITEKYEKEKKEIALRYADVEMAIKMSEIVANTALAVAQALTLGPVAAAIVTPLVIATGAAQLATAISERNKIKGLETGGDFNVTRKQDGKNFKATYGGTKRGYISRPTVLVGENNKREYVVPNAALRNPEISKVIGTIEHLRTSGNYNQFKYQDSYNDSLIVRGYEDGGFTNNQTTESINTNQSANTDLLLTSINQNLINLNNSFNSLDNNINYWQSNLSVSYSSWEDANNEMTELKFNNTVQ